MGVLKYTVKREFKLPRRAFDGQGLAHGHVLCGRAPKAPRWQATQYIETDWPMATLLDRLNGPTGMIVIDPADSGTPADVAETVRAWVTAKLPENVTLRSFETLKSPTLVACTFVLGRR